MDTLADEEEAKRRRPDKDLSQRTLNKKKKGFYLLINSAEHSQKKREGER